jgi:hypothetical protein
VYCPRGIKRKAPLYPETTVFFIWYTDVPENPWAMLREHWDIREKPQTGSRLVCIVLSIKLRKCTWWFVIM